VPASNIEAEEQALILRAQQGDATALAALYQRHAPALFRYFMLRLHERTVAEDLTGEVFVKVVEGLEHYEQRGTPLAAWLFRIAHARLVDYVRRTSRRPTTALLDSIEDPQNGPELQAAEDVDRQTLMQAIASLSDDQKLVIQLRFIESYSLEDVAHIMRKTIGAVKALQHRALNNLGRQLKPQ
jgi:RNA polymerase sigma-70 factor (ECF subfamily)